MIIIENSGEIQNQLSPQAIAKVFEKLYEREVPQLVLLGKQSIDDDSNATGQLLAGILNLPQVTIHFNDYNSYNYLNFLVIGNFCF